MRWALLLTVTALLAGTAAAPAGAATTTNATYFNDAAVPAADPYVLHDPSTGEYYAYSTDGADPGHYFGVYRSADLVTWEKAGPIGISARGPNPSGQGGVSGSVGYRL